MDAKKFKIDIQLETSPEEIKKAAVMVGQAFIHDATPHTLEIWKAVRPENRAKRYGKIFSITLKQPNKNILIARIDDEIVGCLCFYNVKYTKLTFTQRLIMLIPFINASGRSFFNFLKLQALIESLVPKGNWLHLGPVAVDINYQGQGIGSQLMKAFIDMVEKEKMPVFLHTGKERNLIFYERFGFYLTQKTTFLNSPIWATLRDKKADL